MTIHGVIVQVDCYRCNGRGWVDDHVMARRNPGALKPCGVCGRSGKGKRAISLDAFVELLTSRMGRGRGTGEE